jgi:mannose/cellobiose epimerase-like protein (N-acyl-D-glucosamine 2-epimerase family)
VVVADGRQVEVEEHEQIGERVAAIDVAKASGMVCTRVPHQSTPGKRITRVWEVAATTNAIIALADQLTGQGIQRVVVESTSHYWRGLSTCWKPVAVGVAGQRWRRPSRSRAGPRPTSSMRCGWPS